MRPDSVHDLDVGTNKKRHFAICVVYRRETTFVKGFAGTARRLRRSHRRTVE